MYTPWENANPPPRAWQADALPKLQTYVDGGGRAGLLSVIMGAGKTRYSAEVARWWLSQGERLLLTVPSQRLVRQTRDAFSELLGNGVVGTYWQGDRAINRVTIACTASLDALAEEVYWPRAWIVDEAHGSEAPRVLAYAEAVRPQIVIGMSATPYRSSDKEALSLFRDLIYEYTAADALRDGVLVPWRLPRPLIARAGDPRVDLDDACTAWIEEEVWQETGPGIVDARDIADAEEYAAEIRDAGVRAEAVHSKASSTLNDRRIEALRLGELDCVVHVNVLTEGVDMPWLRWGCLRQRRGSRNKHVQHIGRFLRAHPGKTHCNLFDPHGLLGLHGIADPARLGDYLRKEAAEREEIERIPLIDPLTGEEFEPDAPVAERRRVMAGSDAHAWLSSASSALRAAGMAAPGDDTPNERRWRAWPATPKQLAMIGRYATTMHWAAHATEPDALALRDLARAWRAVHARRSEVRRGVASDLITCLACSRQETRPAYALALANHGVAWPEPTEILPIRKRARVKAA